MSGSAQPSTLVVLAAGQAKRYGGLKPLAPVGPGGEAILDLLASDALAAGFSRLIVVISPKTGPEIRRHVGERWPSDLDVRFCIQETPRGTVDAVLAAWDELADAAGFGVANADDLYGSPALAMLGAHLGETGAENGLVAFRLDHAVIGSSPVTRGVCRTDDDGYLVGIEERRGVTRRDDGNFDTGDDRSPSVLGPDLQVSMNLWAFSTSLEEPMRDAMAGADEDEVLLPELVARLVSRGGPKGRFRVLCTDSRCVGVTHPGDLEIVQRDVTAQVERGERPRGLWAER